MSFFPSISYSASFLSFYLLIIPFTLYSLINPPSPSSLFHGRALMTEMGMRMEPWIWAGLEGWGRAVGVQCWPPCSPCRPSGRPCSTATVTRWAQQSAGTCLWTTPRSNAWTRTTRRYYTPPAALESGWRRTAYIVNLDHCQQHFFAHFLRCTVECDQYLNRSISESLTVAITNFIIIRR